MFILKAKTNRKDIKRLIPLLLAPMGLAVVALIIDVLLFKLADLYLLAIVSYLLYPVFGIIYGIVSYRMTKRVILPNLLYMLSCILFDGLLFLVASIFNPFASSQFSQDIIFALVILALLLAVSMAASLVLSIISSVLTKLSLNRKKEGPSSVD